MKVLVMLIRLLREKSVPLIMHYILCKGEQLWNIHLIWGIYWINSRLHVCHSLLSPCCQSSTRHKSCVKIHPVFTNLHPTDLSLKQQQWSKSLIGLYVQTRCNTIKKGIQALTTLICLKVHNYRLKVPCQTKWPSQTWAVRFQRFPTDLGGVIYALLNHNKSIKRLEKWWMHCLEWNVCHSVFSVKLQIVWSILTLGDVFLVFFSHLDAILKSTDWITKTEKHLGQAIIENPVREKHI